MAVGGIPQRGLPARGWPDRGIPYAPTDGGESKEEERIRRMGLIDPAWFGLLCLFLLKGRKTDVSNMVN